MTQVQPQTNDEAPQDDDVVDSVDSADKDDKSQPEPDIADSPQPDFDPKAKVEFSTPEQQRKFNDVYKQMKMSDSRNKMQTDMLAKAMDKISELESRFSSTDKAEAERILNTRLKEARDSGDEDKADKILQEIIDFRVDSKLSKVTPPSPPKPAVDDADVQTVVAFAQETDARGNLLRPWISETHPAHQNAMKVASAVAISVNAEYGYVDVGEVMRRMDDAMKPKPQPLGNSRAPDPMRGNLTNNSAKGKMKLSPQELDAAKKLGVKPEDYLKWKR